MWYIHTTALYRFTRSTTKSSNQAHFLTNLEIKCQFQEISRFNYSRNQSIDYMEETTIIILLHWCYGHMKLFTPKKNLPLFTLVYPASNRSGATKPFEGWSNHAPRTAMVHYAHPPLKPTENETLHWALQVFIYLVEGRLSPSTCTNVLLLTNFFDQAKPTFTIRWWDTCTPGDHFGSHDQLRKLACSIRVRYAAVELARARARPLICYRIPRVPSTIIYVVYLYLHISKRRSSDWTDLEDQILSDSTVCVQCPASRSRVQQSATSSQPSPSPLLLSLLDMSSATLRSFLHQRPEVSGRWLENWLSLLCCLRI